MDKEKVRMNSELSKKEKIIIAMAVAVVALIIVYFAVILSLVNAESGTKDDPPETIDQDEVVGINNRLQMFEYLEKASIQSIHVENKHGEYEFYRDSSGNFQIKGYEGVSYDLIKFSSLIVSSGYTISKERVVELAGAAEYEQYGLDEPTARWTVTSTRGKSYTVLVGSELVTGGGYYCALEGRDAVYVLDSSLEETILQPIEELVTPTLIAGMSTTDYYYTDNFKIYKNGELFVHIAIKPDDEKNNSAAILENKFIFPEGYLPNVDKYYELLYIFTGNSKDETEQTNTSTAGSFVGDSVAVLGVDEIVKGMYGLLSPAYSIEFDYNDYHYVLSFSEKQEDGSYYGYSNLNPNVIVKCSGDKFSFIEDELIDWCSSTIFDHYITNISSIKVKNDKYDVLFTLNHGKDSEGTSTLDVTTNIGINIPNSDVYNFRKFYQTFLVVQIQDFTPLTEAEAAELVKDESSHMLTFTYTTLKGDKTEISFYRYTNRHALVTINGRGQFFVITDIVEKISNDTGRVLAGEPIDSYGKN